MEEKKKFEFTVPVEQRAIMNAGHGPPFHMSPTNGSFGNRTLDYHERQHGSFRNFDNFGTSPRSAAGFRDNRNLEQCPPTFPPLDMKEERTVLMDAIKKKDLVIQRLTQELEEHQASARRSSRDDLLRQREELKTQLLEDVKSIISRRLNEYNPSSGHTEDEFVNLILSEDLSLQNNVDKRDEDPMMKSVQCSEASLEESYNREHHDVVKHEDEGLKKKEQGVSSSSSSTSFEVVRNGSSDNSPLDRSPSDDEAGRKVQRTLSVESKAEMKFLRSEVERMGSVIGDLTRKLDEGTRERDIQQEEMQRKVEEIMNRIQRDEEGRERQKRTTEPLKVEEDVLEVHHDLSSRDDWSAELQDLRRKVQELDAANCKLSEQKFELMRNNDELMKLVRERGSRGGMDSRRLEEELSIKTARIADLEEALEAERRRCHEIEMKMERIMHHEHFGRQDGTSVLDISSENAVLKHQIEAYKEDFEVERKDRERLVAQKESLQRCYDTLYSDLDVARTQVRKFENEMMALRSDNNTLRNKLREVTEELCVVKEQQDLKGSAPPGGATKSVAPPGGAASTKPGAQNVTSSSGQSSDWECKVCTFKNPAPRSFCEMCGTHEPSRPSSSVSSSAATASGGMLQATSCHFVPNIPLQRVNATPKSSSPILSNLKNYGDIETD